ncbi:MAG: LamG domain-containing protein [Verrucomicrobia bacterium]|nr:LamG domain-containing protein [Verrucomicrobiota bacterium]
MELEYKMKKILLALLLGLGFVPQNQELKAQDSSVLYFNGSNSIIEFPAIRFDEYEEFTTEAWVYNWSGYLFSQGPFGDPENSVWMATGNNYYSFGWESDKGHPNHEFSTGLPQPGKWVHVAMVYDGSNQIIFVQGKLANKAEAPKSGPLEPNRSFTIGAEPSPGPEFESNYGSGLIRALRISNKARYSEDFVPLKDLVVDQNTMFYLSPQGIKGTKAENSANNEHNGLQREVSVVQEVDIKTVVMKGIVLGLDEAPLDNCSVSLISENQRLITVKTNMKGEFHFILNTPESIYEIIAQKDGLRRGIKEIDPSVSGNDKLKISLKPSNFPHLIGLGFLTGDWYREMETNGEHPSRLDINYKWGINGNHIHGFWAYKINGITWMSGNSTVYWDPVKKEINKRGFDTRGSQYKSVLSIDEQGNVVELRTSTNIDGEEKDSGIVIKRINNKSYTRQRMSMSPAGDLEAVDEGNTIIRVPKYIK